MARKKSKIDLDRSLPWFIVFGVVAVVIFGYFSPAGQFYIIETPEFPLTPCVNTCNNFFPSTSEPNLRSCEVASDCPVAGMYCDRNTCVNAQVMQQIQAFTIDSEAFRLCAGFCGFDGDDDGYLPKDSTVETSFQDLGARLSLSLNQDIDVLSRVTFDCDDSDSLYNVDCTGQTSPIPGGAGGGAGGSEEEGAPRDGGEEEGAEGRGGEEGPEDAIDITR